VGDWRLHRLGRLPGLNGRTGHRLPRHRQLPPLASLLLFASALLVMAFGPKRFTQPRIASSLGVIEVRAA